MSNYHVEPIDKPAALTKEAIKSLRKQQVQGLSRRQLMRAALGTGIGLWLLEVTAGTLGVRLAEPHGRLRRADQDRRPRHGQAPELLAADRGGLPGLLLRGPGVRDPVDPGQQRFLAGEDDDRRRHRAQRAGALPALPAPRLQAQPVPQELLARVPVPRLALRPPRDQGRRRRSTGRRRAGWTASRSRVDGAGVLTINTGKITLGPLPVALGQPGLIPPRTPTGCI